MKRVDEELTLTEFTDMFKRSRKGNLWCRHGRDVLTVFQTIRETYSWCIANAGGQDYAPEEYTSEEDALAGLYNVIQG